MEMEEIINKAKKEIEIHKGFITYDKTMTNLSRSFVCVLSEVFNCSTWSSVCHFIEENTTFKFNWSKTISENINDFVKKYNNQLEVE